MLDTLKTIFDLANGGFEGAIQRIMVFVIGIFLLVIFVCTLPFTVPFFIFVLRVIFWLISLPFKVFAWLFRRK